jgi:hypothetical protein
VDAGVWHEVDGGYELHDYLDWQPSRAQVAAERAARATAGERGNHRRWHVGRQQPDPACPMCIAEGIAPAIANGIANAIAPANPQGIPPARPGPSSTSNSLQEQHSQTPTPAAAAEEVAQRRGLPGIAAGKERPQRWLDAAVKGIERDLRAHPDFGRLAHEGADVDAFADLLEPRTTLRSVPPIAPHEPDPFTPITGGRHAS